MEERCRPQYWTQLGSGQANDRDSTLCCIIVNVATNGDYIEVYAGKDVTSGRKVFKLKALANRSITFNITGGVFCQGGIYVNASETTVEWTVVYLDLSPRD